MFETRTMADFQVLKDAIPFNVCITTSKNVKIVHPFRYNVVH